MPTNDFLTVLTCVYKDTKGEANLALKLAKFLLRKYPSKKVRVIFALDTPESLSSGDIWQQDMLNFCTANNINPDRVQVLLRVSGADKLGLGISTVDSPVYDTKFDPNTKMTLKTETQASIASRKEQTQRNLLDPAVDLSDSHYIFAYPLGVQFRILLKKLKMPCVFIGPYGEQTTNPLTATILRTGLDPNCQVPGIWINAKQSGQPEVAAKDQTKIAEIQHGLTNPQIYFSHSSAMHDNVLKQSHVTIENFIRTILQLESAKSPRDILIYCNLSAALKEALRPSAPFYQQLIETKRFKQIIVGGKLVYSNPAPNASSLPLLKLADPFPNEPSTFQYLMANSQSLVMVTGNSSLIEAIEAGKIPFYQCMIWDKDFLDEIIKINRALGYPNTILADYLSLCNGIHATHAEHASLHYAYKPLAATTHASNPQEDIAKFLELNKEKLLESIKLFMEYLRTNFEITKSLDHLLDIILDPEPNKAEELYTQIYLHRLTELANVEHNNDLLKALQQRYSSVEDKQMLDVVLAELKTKSETELFNLAKQLGSQYATTIYDELQSIFTIVHDQNLQLKKSEHKQPGTN